jgi:hypothetical protein
MYIYIYKNLLPRGRRRAGLQCRNSDLHPLGICYYFTQQYAISRKVAGLRPSEVIFFFSIYPILPAALGPGVHYSSNKK